MTVAIADGPLGLEAVHTWNGGFALNSVAALPRVRVDRITGLHSLPEADDIRAQRTARTGEVTYPSYSRGKTVVYTGRVQAATAQDLRAKVAAMRAAFADRSNEGSMGITPDAGYGTVAWSYAARVLQLDIDDEQPFGDSHQPSPWERTFTLGLRMSDPRFYLVGPDEASGSIASASSFTAVNQGTAPTDPVFTVGPVGSGVQVDLTNTSVTTSNGTARLRFLSMPAAGVLTVDFAARSAVVVETGSGTQYDAPWDTQYSQWWDELIPGLAPGNNVLTVTGGAWAVDFTSASW